MHVLRCACWRQEMFPTVDAPIFHSLRSPQSLCLQSRDEPSSPWRPNGVDLGPGTWRVWRHRIVSPLRSISFLGCGVWPLTVRCLHLLSQSCGPLLLLLPSVHPLFCLCLGHYRLTSPPPQLSPCSPFAIFHPLDCPPLQPLSSFCFLSVRSGRTERTYGVLVVMTGGHCPRSASAAFKLTAGMSGENGAA